MVITYYIKLFRTGAHKHNGILMSVILPVWQIFQKKIPSKQMHAQSQQ